MMVLMVSNHLVETFQAALFFGKDNPADHILTVADLAVEVTMFGQHLTAFQIDELAVNRGGADVHGDGIVAVGGVSGLDVDDLGLAALHHRPGQGGGDPESVLAQRVGNFADYRQAHRQAVFVVVQLQVADQPGDVGQVILVVGFGQFNVDFFHRRQKQPLFLQIVEIHLLDAGRAPRDVALAEDAGVDGRLNRHTHDHILGDRRPAGQTDPFSRSAGLNCSLRPPSTSPVSTMTRHLPQTPSPPQEALMCTPASMAARIRLSPSLILISRLWGRNLMVWVVVMNRSLN
jgi:hypothetical protein